jgi:hypothetical protein
MRLFKNWLHPPFIKATAKIEILLQKAIERLDIKEDFYNLVFLKIYKP